MVPFDFQPRTRIVFGADKVDELGELTRELGVHRVLVVTDPGVMRAGHTERGLQALRRAGLDAWVFSDVCENPSTRDVASGVEFARDYRPEAIVGLGGGSSMDCAKGINFLYSNGGQLKDYWGVGKATQPMLPMIAVPTTAGTGSETQSFALISDEETKVKMACGDKKAACRVALLDPLLTVTQPPRVTALTGIDAIAHAVETYVTRRRNPASLAFSREAWQLLAGNFAQVLQDPGNVEARSGMQLGACFAGLAIENSMLGATHALANPLTAVYGCPHGEAIALMMPHVIRFNGVQVGDWYRELVEATSHEPHCPDPRDGYEGLADFIGQLVEQAGLATRLRDVGVAEERLAELAEAATLQWTGTFNPREVGFHEFLQVYRSAL